LAALRETSLFELWAFLGCRRRAVGWEVDVRHGGGVFFVVVEVAAEGSAAEDGLDELVLAEGFGEVVLFGSGSVFDGVQSAW
jgi:hypothetical protein